MSQRHDDIDLPVAFFENIKDNKVSVVSVLTWKDLRDLLSTHDVRSEKDGMLFTTAIFKDPEEIDEHIDGLTPRKGEYISLYYALLLDFDGGETIEKVKKQLIQYEHFGYTSHNHWNQYNVQKFRVVLPLAEAVEPEEIRVRQDAILEWLGDADKSTLAVGRVFYLPSVPASKKHFARTWYHEGDLLNIKRFEAKKVELAPTDVKTSYSGDDAALNNTILDELRKCSIEEESEWFRVGASMFASGYSLADYQSISWPEAAKACSDKWKRWQHSAPVGNRGFLVNYIRSHSNPDFLVKKQSQPTTLKQIVISKRRK